MKFSGDMLMISMHSNVFNFDDGHCSFSNRLCEGRCKLKLCGVIYVPNFLADSIKYNRLADEGSLVARILVNKEKHFLVEGEGALGLLYEDFSTNLITEK
jgi:hypothetical protein